MLNAERCRAIAEELTNQHRTRQPQKPLPESDVASLEEAYAVQDVFVPLLTADGQGGRVGYKIALTSKAMQEMVGVDQPLAGVILESRLFASPHALALSGYQHVGLEFEIAVRIGASLHPWAGHHTVDTVSSNIAAIAAAFELVEDRNADYTKVDARSLVADNCWNGGNVIGPWMTEPESVDLAATPARLDLNATLVEESNTAEVLGHPYAVVAWLANHLNARGQSLEEGMIVMTGSCMKTRFPAPGDRYDFSVTGVGNASIMVAE